jgi:prepilin-type N-terminal cleavage/methylation domain-containing protein
MMMRTQHRPAERGFSLAEVLTATAIFAVIFVAALLIYDRSNKMFKQGVEASDMQQNTRVAFDKLVADVRMTGFDFDRDGNPASSLANPWQPNTPYSPGNLVQPDPPNGNTYQAVNSGTSVAAPFTPWDPVKGTQTVEPGGTLRWENMGSIVYQQPDEQIEYAGPAALIVRSNFDYDFETGPCPVAVTTPCENGRERRYETPAFGVITTGNDEIVAYALRPMTPPPSWSPPAMTFYADLTMPRNVHPGTGNDEQLISIPNVDLCTGGCNLPPYTLFRFNWDDAGNRVETPLADNIRSLEFRYFRDVAASVANEITTLPLGAGQYDGSDPDEIIPERDTRADMRAVRVNLVGMNPQRDGDFVDPTDTVARNYRKYSLESVIVPRNIGRRGMKEFTTTAPGAPVLNTVCVGSCNAVYLAWTAPGVGGDVETYNILYDTADCAAATASGFKFAEDAGRNVEGFASQFIANIGAQYSFAVQSINKFGTAVSNCIEATVINKTRPESPTALKASGGDDAAVVPQENQIQLFWPPVTTNEDANKTTSCNNGLRDEKDIPAAEVRFYRIYRSKKPAVDIADPLPPDTTKVVDEFTLQQPSSLGAEMTWIDTSVANCLDYYYRIRVVDFCARQASYNEGADATLGESAQFFPPLGTDGIRGMASTVKKPAAPEGLAISNRDDDPDSDPSTTLSNYTLVWSAVTKNDGDPTGPTIFVDKYIVKVSKKTLITPMTFLGSEEVTGGALTYVYKDLETPLLTNGVEYEFTITAMTCVESDPSTVVRDPCIFGGGGTPAPVSITPDIAYGGTGIAGDPWIVENGSLVVSTTAGMATMNVQFTQTDPVTGNPVPVGSASFSSIPPSTPTAVAIPVADDGMVTQAVFSITDSSGCSVSDVKFVIDEPSGNCTLIDASISPKPTPPVSAWVAASPGGRTTVTIHNDSDNQIEVKELIITWRSGSANRSADQLTTVIFPSSTVTASCPTPAATSAAQVSTRVAPSSAELIAARSNMSAIVNFHEPGGNQPIAVGIINPDTGPISQVCVVYQITEIGDTLTCPIIPNAGASCTVPGTNCQ